MVIVFVNITSTLNYLFPGHSHHRTFKICFKGRRICQLDNKGVVYNSLRAKCQFLCNKVNLIVEPDTYFKVNYFTCFFHVSVH